MPTNSKKKQRRSKEEAKKKQRRSKEEGLVSFKLPWFSTSHFSNREADSLYLAPSPITGNCGRARFVS